MNSFPEVSLLVTHYNRSQSLENLLVSFRTLDCEFAEVVVSDDGSDVEHLDRLLTLQKSFHFKLITTIQNRGLGNNINKGQDSIVTPYTLYVQEDFSPTHIFPGKLKESLKFLKKDDDLDIVRYYSYGKYPYLTPFKNGFSRMYVNPFGRNYRKVYCYSDHPHLRRSDFFEKFGRYEEGLKVEKTEYQMCLAFIHNKGNGIFYNDYKSLFEQKNSVSEPSTVSRDSWKRSNNFIISFIRDIYRQIKYNFHISIAPLFRSK